MDDQNFSDRLIISPLENLKLVKNAIESEIRGLLRSSEKLIIYYLNLKTNIFRSFYHPLDSRKSGRRG